MYAAELKGKLSSKVEGSEDILTSNVFSFFKYADRKTFLRKLLKMEAIGVEASDEELQQAEFHFWPYYENQTEPDLVVTIGKYFLLFEAKLNSDFAQGTEQRKGQIAREIEAGLEEARHRKCALLFIAVTADYLEPRETLNAETLEDFEGTLRWINWQSITHLLLDLLDECGESPPDHLFASDLLALLEKKNLRGFTSWDRLAKTEVRIQSGKVFFSAESATFRGRFIGFINALSNCSFAGSVPEVLFFKKHLHFRHLPEVDLSEANQLFFRRRQ